MDVKDTGRVDPGLSIPTMLAEVAIAKNAENRELLEKPVREESQEAKQAGSRSPPDKDIATSAAEKAGSQPVANSTKIVDVSV